METDVSSRRPDIYSRVTNEIVHAIELGVSKYEMPWHRPAGAGLPRNPVTRNAYRGVNTVSLWSTGRVNGYVSPYWASYLQWKTLGAQVKQGERGSPVVFYKSAEITDKNQNDDGDENERSRAVLRHSTVFNSEQVEGWSALTVHHITGESALYLVDTFINGLQSDIRYGSDSAYYIPSTDRICMPNRGDFVDTGSGSSVEGFYAVLLHEHVHWSGHPKRLKRDLSGRFGSNAYAMEELVAELGAAFLCATLGISSSPRPDHAAYIESWLRVLKQNKSAIFVAASAASVASQFLYALVVKNGEEVST
ncbi:MAG: ArdC family protein [Acidimicrobiales bacterium]